MIKVMHGNRHEQTSALTLQGFKLKTTQCYKNLTITNPLTLIETMLRL